jgi:putative ABC transport system permease protein
MTARLIRIDRVHLLDGLNPGAQSRLVVTAAIALIILFASCVVFVNLATARSLERALEVGVRKACGAGRSELIRQFLGESVLYVAVAACLALALAALVLPFTRAFLDLGGHLDLWHDPLLLGAMLALVVAVGVLAGAYPAFVLSAFRPGTVLKGAVLGSGGALARQALVALQFAVLIGLMVAASVIYRQCVYVTRDALRVTTERMLLVRAVCKPALLNELRALPEVRAAYCSSDALISRAAFNNFHLRDGTTLAIDVTALDFAAFGLYGVSPIAGRIPTLEAQSIGPAQQPADVVINETAARTLGFASPRAAIGQRLPLSNPSSEYAGLEIVAVVPDFAFDVGLEKVRATLYMGSPAHDGIAPPYRLINVKLSGQNIPQTLAAIDRIGVATGADPPLERIFLSQYIENLYVSILREAQALAAFAAVAVALACLGLLGLAAAAAQRRTREIGIRKAMGAGSRDIVRMLLWQFSKPILLANLIAWPVSAWLLMRWLEGFADHVTLSPLTFVAAGALALAIALLTVTGHALAIARARPVEALRYE